MATKIWQGGAPAVAQVTDFTFGGTWEADDVVIVTIGTRSVSITAGSTTTNTVVDNVVTAWNSLSSSVYPEFAEVTASRSSSNLRLTADTAGRPFTVSVTTTEAGGGAADAQTIGSATTVTACSGPNHWDTAANWSGASVPVNSDDAVIESNDFDILYGLDQNAVDLTSLTIKQSFTGNVGLALVNTSGDANYYEYRDRYLKIGFTTLNFGQGDGAGCPLANINGDGTLYTANIYNTGESEDTNRPALLLLGTNTSNVINVNKGSVGLAYEAGTAIGAATVNVGYRDNAAGDSTVKIGSGATPLTAVNIRGGVVEINANSVTITMTDGELSLMGTMTVTTLNIDGGVVYQRSSGTITTANVGDGGTLDFRRDMRSRTVTTINVFSGATLLDPNQSVTFTNNIDLERCAIADVTIDLGTNIKLSRGTPS